MSKKIAVYYDGSPYTFRWLKALKWARKEFRDFEVSVTFISPWHLLPFRGGRQTPPRLLRYLEADAVLVAHHWTHEFGIGVLSTGRVVEILDDLRQVAGQVVWLDSADSTGTARLELAPYVDGYWKKQLLIDRSAYSAPFWAGRPHAKYYRDTAAEDWDLYGEREFAPLDASIDPDSLKVSWNVGAGDLFCQSEKRLYAQPSHYQTPRFVDVKRPRPIDIQFRGTEWPGASGWQRTTSVRLMEERAKRGGLSPSVRLAHEQYVDEVASSRAVLSPFGWGEICTRDFESWVGGAALIKPRMDHLETFPDWYEKDQTYLPLEWDFSNFDSLAAEVDDLSDRVLAVARNGQEQYRTFLAAGGRRRLVEHVLNNLGWI